MVAQHIDDNNSLGRGCFQSKEAHRNNPRAPYLRHSFVGGSMSVDWLDHADGHSLRDLHIEEAERRLPPRTRTFYGWHVFRAESLRLPGWHVEHDPTHANPWHTQVRLPDPDRQEADALLQDCTLVASKAIWKDLPLSPAVEEFLTEVTEG